MAAAEEPLIQLGVSAFEDQGLWDGNDNHGFCSMVAHNEDLLQAFRVAGSSGLSLQYAAIPRPGSFFGVSRVMGAQEELRRADGAICQKSVKSRHVISKTHIDSRVLTHHVD